jgi:plastocyanin
MNTKALTLAGLCVLAAALALPAGGAAGTPPTLRPRTAALATTTIKVTTYNSSYHLSARTAPPGVVIFKVTNKAVFGHDFSINGHTTRVLKTGQSATLRVTFLKPGHYVYKDTMDHHAQWGDIGGFTIT